MISPLAHASLLDLPTCESTQQHALLLIDAEPKVGVVLAREQTAGKGRFDREWYSETGGSFTASFILHVYADAVEPWLLGMSFALAVAGVCHCRVAWPNDLMLNGFKCGGILTNIATNNTGKRIPVVGVGINLSVSRFPSTLDQKAANLDFPISVSPVELVETICQRLEQFPEPTSWEAIQPIWTLFDDTAGKNYRLPSGETAIAIAVGPHAELICAVDGVTQSVMVADALGTY